VQSSHAVHKTHVSFDDEHLVLRAGPASVLRLAESCGLPALTGEHLRVADKLGANADAKLPQPGGRYRRAIQSFWEILQKRCFFLQKAI
jgi:hypothetical protein